MSDLAIIRVYICKKAKKSYSIFSKAVKTEKRVYLLHLGTAVKKLSAFLVASFEIAHIMWPWTMAIALDKPWDFFYYKVS